MGKYRYVVFGLGSLLVVGQALAEVHSETDAVEELPFVVAWPSIDDEALLNEDSPVPLLNENAAQDLSQIQWLPSYGFQCRPYRGRVVCDGPRRVPEPFGPSADLANELELGRRSTASALMIDSPRSEWVEAVVGEPPEALLWPVEEGELSRGLGYVRRGSRTRLHKGFDINADEGAQIRAVADGLVAYSDNGMRGYGNLLIVIHADQTVALYAHCRAIYVFAGQHVRAGQVVGEVGHTGNAMGPHLHFELRREGRPQDPYPDFDEVVCRRPRYCEALERRHQAILRRNPQ